MPDPYAFEILLEELTQTRLGRRTFLALAPQLLAACATGRNKSQTNMDQKHSVQKLTVEDEILIARRALPEIRRDYPALQDSEVQNYLLTLGQKLATRANLTHNPYSYSFTVVDVPMVNAFALPAGPIFVTTPLLKMVETEAELAGVLGHEIGHVQARHAAKKIQELESAKGQSWWYGSGGAVVGSLAGAALSSVACAGNSTCASTLIVAGAAAGVNGGLLVQKYIFLAHTRENELEADRKGFQTALTAGYSAKHIGDFYSRLQSVNSKAPQLQDVLQTHPPSAERVLQMRKLEAQVIENPAAVLSSKGFDQMKQRLQSL